MVKTTCELLFLHNNSPGKWKFFAICTLPFGKSSLCNLWCFPLSQFISIKLYLSLSLSPTRAGKIEIFFRWEKGPGCWTWVKDLGFLLPRRRTPSESDCHFCKGRFLPLHSRDVCTRFHPPSVRPPVIKLVFQSKQRDQSCFAILVSQQLSTYLRLESEG